MTSPGCVSSQTFSLAVAAFVIAATKPMTNPWPSLIAGFCVTAVGIVLLTTERRPKNGTAR
jgi:hypothetical protein